MDVLTASMLVKRQWLVKVQLSEPVRSQGVLTGGALLGKEV
jgi:hypothetical protein